MLYDLQAPLDEYRESQPEASYGSRQQPARKNADKAALVTLLRDTATAVNTTAKGDMQMLSSCGMPLNNDRQRSVLGQPSIKVKRDHNGQLSSCSPAVPGSVMYKHQYTTDPAAPHWQEVASTRANCKIPGLVPGQVYYFRIIGRGTRS